MPLSEFLRMARKNELGLQKPCPTNLSSRPDNDFLELVWENGQIMMQGQSSRATNNLPPNPNKACESRTGKFCVPDSISNDMSPVIVPSDDFNLSQDDEMVPWLDALAQDYGSVLLPEISGVTANDGTAQNSFRSGVSNLQRSSLALQPQHHRQTSDALGSGVSDNNNNNNNNNNNRHPDVQIIKSPTNNSNSFNYLNFSHFARPANLVKAKVSSGVERVDIDQVKPTPVSNCVQPVSNEIKDSFPAERIENLCQEKNDKPVNPSNTNNLIKCGVRIVEPMVASSSVGSGNSNRVSCEQTLNSKRKFRDTEEFECHSDDVDTESVGVKRSNHARGNGSKRSRAAEVHNLSERRRRDRINEKMRALQELIPNCNKADKASMLDEAIEYLKTLQLQVQFMSMGAGLCMPQMMFTPGMQHMHPAHIPHFPPMGMGMGTGMGFGMSMLGSPVFPVSPLTQPHFPANFQRMPGGPNPVYGHPGQGFPNSAMGLSGFRNGVQNAVPPVLNSGDITNTNSQLICNAEAGNSINLKSDQVHATNEVQNRSATAQDNKQPTGASGPATNISKEPGGH